MNSTPTMTRYLITGVNSYLGKNLASHLLGKPGNMVLTTSRGPCEFDAQRVNANHRHLPGLDLLADDGPSRLSSAAEEWTDRPFTVVNAVGYFPGYRSICEISVAEARRIIDGNFMALFATATAVLPVMKKNGGGQFIAFSTHAVRQSYPLMSVFTAAKAAVDSMVQTITNEYYKDNIVANSLAIATLNSPKEREMRPGADAADWLSVEQVSDFIEHISEAPFRIMNGNVLHLFNYSDSFFNRSYFDRLGTESPPGKGAVN